MNLFVWYKSAWMLEMNVIHEFSHVKGKRKLRFKLIYSAYKKELSAQKQGQNIFL